MAENKMLKKKIKETRARIKRLEVCSKIIKKKIELKK
jgi:hypothetical protein